METEESVRLNVRRLRQAKRFTVRKLSEILGALGHPIVPSSITKIEDGTRKVTVSDLVALAQAFGKDPAVLLMPPPGENDQDQNPVAQAVREAARFAVLSNIRLVEVAAEDGSVWRFERQPDGQRP